MNFEEDLDIFTDNEFSTVAIVDSATSDLTELSGLFDENYQAAFDLGVNLPAEGRNFCFQAQTQLTTDLRHGDGLTIHGKKYLIVSIQPKHDGAIAEIILKQDFS